MPGSMQGEPLGSPGSSGQAWPAPAKLNLCLHIVGRRADGYHLLQSAIQFIDLCDELRFFRRDGGVIERIAGPAEVPAESDLVVRAARLLAAHAQVTDGVGIELTKRIPMQGGLGGGSSDAATVLVALNVLWGLKLATDELAALGLELGADVPVFVRGRAAWVEGIGEQITPADFPEKLYLVVKPDAALSTAEVFQAPELTRNSPITTIRAFLAGGGRNDCTSSVRGRYPEVAQALDWLENFGEARLTGTGACVFAALPDEGSARAALARMPARWTGYIARGMNVSPLLGRVESWGVAKW
jgi:4-diphosphocytidyl-2-C-methyl-D-erythritol kinase